MKQQYEYTIKRPGEKLLRVGVESDRGVIHSVKISGDFFIFPEESITLIEESLTGTLLDEECIIEHIQTIISEHAVTLTGISAETIAFALVSAG